MASFSEAHLPSPHFILPNGGGRRWDMGDIFDVSDLRSARSSAFPYQGWAVEPGQLRCNIQPAFSMSAPFPASPWCTLEHRLGKSIVLWYTSIPPSCDVSLKTALVIHKD